MKRGPQPKKVFDAAQSRARAAKLRELMGVMTNSKMRAGMELLARKFEQRADKLEACSPKLKLRPNTVPQAH
jgi:homogentisate 1,2-dioxygenase